MRHSQFRVLIDVEDQIKTNDMVHKIWNKVY
jgi:hypothetical protein